MKHGLNLEDLILHTSKGDIFEDIREPADKACRKTQNLQSLRNDAEGHLVRMKNQLEEAQAAVATAEAAVAAATERWKAAYKLSKEWLDLIAARASAKRVLGVKTTPKLTSIRIAVSLSNPNCVGAIMEEPTRGICLYRFDTPVTSLDSVGETRISCEGFATLETSEGAIEVWRGGDTLWVARLLPLTHS